MFTDRQQKRSQDPELLAYLQWPGSNTYASLAPVLFANHREHDLDTLFQTELLVLVSSSI